VSRHIGVTTSWLTTVVGQRQTSRAQTTDIR
jgi:hypothetical protein